jgi:hypothetical protein
MKHKMLTIECPDNLRETLATVITQYAYAAYPPGGSECAQASREALQTLAQNIKPEMTNSTDDSYFTMKARQRSILKGAINWYFTEVEQNEQQQALLLKLLG